MAYLTGPNYPPVLDNTAETERLVQTVKDWSIANGLAIRPPPAVAADADGILAIPAPVTLFPSPFPKSCFEEAKAIQTTYNELYARISRDEEFLGKVVEEVAGGDEFIANLWQVHQRVKGEGYVQPLTLGLFRSDYMVHKDGDNLQIKQVEFNTIASSFGGLSSKTSLLHKHLAATEYPLLNTPIPSSSLNLPFNDSAKGLAAGIAAAYRAYGPSLQDRPACVLFLVQDGERNVFDQRHLEYALQSEGIPVFRLPFSQVLQHTTLGEGRELLYRPPHNPGHVFEAAVTYLRAGYGPGDYTSPDAWEARYQIEKSKTIACPSVLTQLAGMKKVQQVLATPETDNEQAPAALRRFAPSEEAVPRLLKTFTNIYPMSPSTPAGRFAQSLATSPEHSLRYVLKPQREGGGNNVYRSAIPAFLSKTPKEHWGSYILMELITPPAVRNVILRNGKIERGGVICELGVYGTCVWDRVTGEVKYNEEAGYLLRTKGEASEEGGVAAGYGCMDSVCLV